MTKMTAAKTLEAIGLNDPTVAALLKELKAWQLTPEQMKDVERIKADAKTYIDEQSNAEPFGGLAKARTIALEQRCEHGTPWDLACVTIANKIGEQCGYPPIPTDAAPPRPADAEPVAWQWRMYGEDWRQLSCDRNYAEYRRGLGAEIRPLYTAPPRPDASAELIEAAVLERYAQSIAVWCYRENVTDHERLSYIANHPITRKYANRARAADRGGK